MPKNLNQLRKGKEFVSHAEKKGAEIRRGKGSHVVIKYKGESFVVPEHNTDLGTGLRAKIIKWFIAIGLGILIFAFLFPSLFIH